MPDVEQRDAMEPPLPGLTVPSRMPVVPVGQILVKTSNEFQKFGQNFTRVECCNKMFTLASASEAAPVGGQQPKSMRVTRMKRIISQL